MRYKHSSTDVFEKSARTTLSVNSPTSSVRSGRLSKNKNVKNLQARILKQVTRKTTARMVPENTAQPTRLDIDVMKLEKADAEFEANQRRRLELIEKKIKQRGQVESYSPDKRKPAVSLPIFVSSLSRQCNQLTSASHVLLMKKLKPRFNQTKNQRFKAINYTKCQLYP